MTLSVNPKSLAVEEKLILVNERDEEVGSAEKHEAHRSGLLHRAFSIFLFDENCRTLLQRRAAGKYHSAGLWANTCCGHPRPGEPVVDAAGRRLYEELGINASLSFGFLARYKAGLDNGMTENELVHVFAGRLSPGQIRPNPEEADALDLVALGELKVRIDKNPERYTYWLRSYLMLNSDVLFAMATRQR